MKKVFLSSLLIISAFMLSSCQVNWFGSHFDVPWYFIAVQVVVLFVVLYVIMISKTYVCPKCKTEFKPKWYQIYITIHFNDSRIAKCPNCGRKGFCKRKDQCHLFCQHISKRKTRFSSCLSFCVGTVLSSRAAARQVFSAQVSLTSVFGMGTGGPSPQSAPTY